jgi:hypothetical protein
MALPRAFRSLPVAAAHSVMTRRTWAPIGIGGGGVGVGGIGGGGGRVGGIGGDDLRGRENRKEHKKD